jgi:hypothetical protein
MRLVASAYSVQFDPEILLVSYGIQHNEAVWNCRVVDKMERVVVGTCAISGGLVNLGDQDGNHLQKLEEPEVEFSG